MENLLQEFYWGNISPSELPIERTLEERKAQKEVLALEEKLRTLLSESAKETFLALDNARIRAEATTEAQIFAYGFELGARFMVEVFT